MKTFTILFGLIILLLSSGAFADDPSWPDLVLDEEKGTEAYPFPKIKTDINFYTGFHLVDMDGANEVVPYEYIKDSVVFGGDLRYTSFPNRLHLDFDFLNENDYFGDAWYTYKDLFAFRAINSTLFHNLPNIDLDPLETSAGVDVRDRGENYGIKSGLSRFYVHGKAPDFPLHVYLDGRLVRKSGDRQQRSLLGGAWFNDIVKSSQDRDIDLETRAVKVGINSHVGPVEVDYAHGEVRFDVVDDDVLYDQYSQSGSNPPRDAGVYPHNLTPEVKSSVDTFKVHTSHTGKITASATLQKTKSENEQSGVESEYFVGGGGVTVKPMPRLAFFFKYYHKDIELENRNTVTLIDQTDPMNSYTYSVRPSISSTTRKASMSARYRPVRWLTLNSGYQYMEIDRSDVEEWGLEKRTKRQTAEISARARIAPSLQAKAEYIYRNFDNPAYNTEPDHANEARLSLTWLPTPKWSTLLSYDIAMESRNDLHFADTNEPSDRDVRKNLVIGSVAYQVLERLSLTLSSAYMIHRIEQDIEYHDTAGLAHSDEEVPYRNKAQSYALDAHYVPYERIALSAGIHHTIGQSSFRPNATDLLEPERISVYSKMRTEETEFNASCSVRLGDGYSSSVRYRHIDLDEDFRNVYDDVRDGEYHSILVTIQKSW